MTNTATQYLKWEAWPSEAVPSLNIEAGALYTVLVEFTPPYHSGMYPIRLTRAFSRQMVFEYTWAVGQAILHMQEHVLDALSGSISEVANMQIPKGPS